jgi:hypothetical protein
MAKEQVTLRTNFTWIDTAIAVALAMVVALMSKDASTGVIAGLLTGIALGVWRAVRFLGALLEQLQAQAGYADEDQFTEGNSE